MNAIGSLAEYQTLSLPAKFTFFEEGIGNFIANTSNQELYQFLRVIIFDEAENENIRKTGLAVFTNCVFLGRIRIRQALTVLLDEWTRAADKQFLESQRLKDLFYYYEEEQEEIENIYKSFIQDSDAELASESYFCLGLINFQKGLASQIDSSTSNYIKECNQFFKSSFSIIENRIDAHYFFLVSRILENIFSKTWTNSETDLERLSYILFQMEASSFSFVPNPFYLSVYNSLVRLSNIIKSGATTWLDIRTGLTNLYNEYSLLQNQILKDRLNQSQISKLFVSTITTCFVEPFFVLNLQADIVRIDARLLELQTDSDEWVFLQGLRNLISDKNYKKKVEVAEIKDTLKKILPFRRESDIEDTIKKISDFSDPSNILNAYYELARPSTQDLVNKLTNACLKLQGTLMYRTASEDDRNSYIANLLEASGFRCKDQTKWGISATGKQPGEIDIQVYDLKQFPIAIIEALNLDSLQADYLILHLDKLFNYDTAGNELNFILVYSAAKKFGDFWNRYKSFVSKHNYKYPLLEFEEIKGYQFSNIRLAWSTHSREQKNVALYHIMVDLQELDNTQSVKVT